MTGLNRTFVLTLFAIGLTLPACSTRGTPRPVPARAKVRIPSSGIEPTSLVPRYNDPLTESSRLEESGAVRRIDGRLPVGPHVSAAFLSRASAHQCERYVHPLTARANGRRNLPIHTAPVAPAPQSSAIAATPAPVRTPVAATPPAYTRPAPAPVSPPSPPSPPSQIATRWAPPRTSTPAPRTPAVHTPPSLPAVSTPVVAAPSEPAAPPFSLSSVPAHLRDVAALQAQEERLADQSIAISMERRAVLRVAKAIREHQRTNTPEARERLEAAYSEYRQGASSSRGLTLNSGAEAFAAAAPAVRDRLDVVNNERKAVTRLIVALRMYEQDPSAANGASLASAVEKYNRR